jgi:hypothetical protein
MTYLNVGIPKLKLDEKKSILMLHKSPYSENKNTIMPSGWNQNLFTELEKKSS